MKLRHLIEPADLTKKEVDGLLVLAQKMMRNPAEYAHICDQKTIATLFYEPSTRTRLSFEAAMLELGGSVLGFSSAESSSAAKGETVADTIRTVANFADIIAIRHPKEGAALAGSMYSTVPIVNAGDGGHLHPTQTLTDLLTIQSLKGRIEDLTIGLCGDLMFGRTVHSLIKALLDRPNIKFVLINPKELHLPDYLLDELLSHHVDLVETERLDDVIQILDVLYMTRVQKERFFNEEDYVRLKNSYILDRKKMKLAKKDMIVMHPLPRVNEISSEVDKDPRAAYFKQVGYGKQARKALIAMLLGVQTI